jgi:hypothetical protein
VFLPRRRHLGIGPGMVLQLRGPRLGDMFPCADASA